MAVADPRAALLQAQMGMRALRPRGSAPPLDARWPCSWASSHRRGREGVTLGLHLRSIGKHLPQGPRRWQPRGWGTQGREGAGCHLRYRVLAMVGDAPLVWVLMETPCSGKT